MIVKRMLPVSRRTILTAATTIGLIAILGLVIVSPLALKELAHSRQDWSQLSNIGQTYGAVSALLSSLALIGVVVSLLYQARDSRTVHEEASRTFQHNLLKMELEDASLMNAFGAPYGLSIPSDLQSVRQFLFIHMWVSFLAGNYVIGESSEMSARYFARDELFRSTAGRRYWEAVRNGQLGESKGRRNRFFRIVDDEYQKALSENIPLADPIATNDHKAEFHTSLRTRQERARQLGLIAIAVALGALARDFWHRSKI